MKSSDYCVSEDAAMDFLFQVRLMKKYPNLTLKEIMELEAREESDVNKTSNNS